MAKVILHGGKIALIVIVPLILLSLLLVALQVGASQEQVATEATAARAISESTDVVRLVGAEAPASSSVELLVDPRMIEDSNKPGSYRMLSPEASVAEMKRIELRRAITTVSDVKEALRMESELIVGYLASGQRDEAIAECGSMLGIAADRELRLAKAMDVAETCYSGGDFTTARAISEQTFAICPTGKTGLRARKCILLTDIRGMDDSNATEAVDNIWKEFADQRSTANTLLIFADEVEAAGHARQARALHQLIRDKWADLPVGSRAATRLALGDIEAADVKSLTTRIDSFLADDSGALAQSALKAAETLRRAGDLAGAKSIYPRIAAKWPKNKAAMNALVGYAKAQIVDGDTRAAKATIAQLKAHFKDNEEFSGRLFSIGEKFREAGQTDEALAVYAYIAKRLPDSSGTVASKIWLRVLGVVDGPAFDVALNAAMTDCAGSEYTSAGLLEVARESHTAAFKDIAFGQVDKGRAELANTRKCLARLQSDFPSEEPSQVSFGMAECFRAAEDYALAIASYEKCIKDEPLGKFAAHAQFMVGECYRIMQEKRIDLDKYPPGCMTRAYNEVLQRYPGSRVALAARARLGVEAGHAEGGVR